MPLPRILYSLLSVVPVCLSSLREQLSVGAKDRLDLMAGLTCERFLLSRSLALYWNKYSNITPKKLREDG
jgi:hypothetical protein